MAAAREKSQFLQLAVIAFSVTVAAQANGQTQVVVPTPATGVSSSYFENFGTNFGANGPGWFFNQGGAGAALPPFGGFDPNAGARLGWGLRTPFGRFNFRMYAAEGSSRTINSTTPMVTLPNGSSGSFGSFLQRPFVTGIVPVVGQPPVRVEDRVGRWAAGERPDSPSPNSPSPGEDAPAVDRSSAARGASSLAAIRKKLAEKDQARDSRYQELMDQADRYEREGKTTVARLIREQAARVRK